MKLKLTESQYEKLRLVREAEDALEKYKDFCNKMADTVNQVYLTVVNSSVIEILNMSINIEELNRKIDKIDTDVYKAEKNMLQMYENGMIGAGIEDFDMIIGDLASSVTDKITSLSLILNTLEKTQEVNQEHNLLRNFKEVKPIEIQSFE